MDWTGAITVGSPGPWLWLNEKLDGAENPPHPLHNPDQGL